MPQLFVLPRQTALDDDAHPLAGALAYFYATETTTLQNIFSDIELTVPLTNPLVADSAGRFPKAYLDSSADANYRIRVTTASGILVYQDDDIDRFTVSDIEVARALYPQTEAEIAANVTPVNFRYAPGNVLRYGNNSIPGTTDMADAINAALRSNTAVYAPAGTYLVNSSILVNSYSHLYGDGWGSSGAGGTVFLATTDIEIIASGNADSDPLVTVYLRDFVCQSTVTDNTASYQIHLRNPIITHIERVYTKSGLADTNYSSTNVGGIWIEDKSPSLEGPYINRVSGCFIQNGGLLFGPGGTDSTIIDNFIYGHCCAHSLKFTGGGGNFAIIGNNITSPPSGAGIEIVGGTQNQYRIIGNFFDGNPAALDSGHGLLVSSAPRVLFCENHVWAMGKNAVRATDPNVLIVTDNIFQNCNDSDGGWSDVVIIGATFQPNMVSVSGNHHVQETSRTNKGFAIDEQNAGFNPVSCTYKNNKITANYLATGNYSSINTLQSGVQGAKVTGNTGGGSETEIQDTFLATLTGVSGTVTGTVRYTRNGNLVSLYFPTITGTSNTTAATLTGVPAALRPANSASAAAIVTNSGTNEIGVMSLDSSGTVTLSRAGLASWTNTGTKGIFVGGTLTYQLV